MFILNYVPRSSVGRASEIVDPKVAGSSPAREPHEKVSLWEPDTE